jgi:hypothetical protein
MTTGERVNLRTKNPTRAIDRGRRARELGERSFVQDDTEGTDKPPAPPTPIAPPTTAAAAAAACLELELGGSEAVVDAVIPLARTAYRSELHPRTRRYRRPRPRGAEGSPAAGWADAANQAARADTAELELELGGRSGGRRQDRSRVHRRIIDTAADICVELQLAGQEWLLKRTAKIKAGDVPLEGPASKGRLVGKRSTNRVSGS